MRTMRDVWDERRKGQAAQPRRPSIVRRLTGPSPAPRRRAPEGTVSPRTWVFSKGSARGPSERRLLVKRTKQPELDLFDEEDELIVLADVPGVSEEDIQISVERDLLIIEAVSAGPPVQVHYYAEAILPYEVRKDFQRACKSGVLELHLRPKGRGGGRTRTKDGRERSVKDPQAGKKKERRKPKNESGKTEPKREGRTRDKRGRKRKA